MIESKKGALRKFFKTNTNEEHNRNVSGSRVQINLNEHEDVENEEIVNEHGVVLVVINEEIVNEPKDVVNEENVNELEDVINKENVES